MPHPTHADGRPHEHARTRSSSSSSSLEPPDIDRILRAKRRWYHAGLDWRFPRAVQVPLTCATICLAAVQANGVYVWPTYGPVVSRRLELGGTEGQTIVVGGILGVYIMAAPLGSLTDRYGPRFGSLVSAFLAAAGYLAFALILQHASPSTPYVHLYLTACYFAVGAATVGSYFAALTCASLSFPSHPTLSLSVPLALISLSSLVLSSFSSLRIFTDPSTDELDPVRFLLFLAAACFGINVLSALFMRILDTPIQLQPAQEGEYGEVEREAQAPRSPTSALLHLDEHTPLLIGGPEAAREDAEAVVRGKERWTAARLVRDWSGFWAFGILLALCIGPSETIIASIGSILTSLLPPTSIPPSTALALRNKHVSILSISGTVSRLLTGLVADHLAPPLTPVAVPHGPGQTDMNASLHIYVQRRPVKLLRASFNAVCALLLAGVFAWSAGWLESERGLWVLSAGTGVMYGALFTLTPAIVSAHFGPTNFGLAWGMISYFAAIGAVIFSYIYALISSAIASIPNHSGFPGAEDPSSTPASGGVASFILSSLPGVYSLGEQSHAASTIAAFTLTLKEQPPACYGTRCFSVTLWIAAACCVVSSAGMFVVGRRWKV